MEMATCSPPGTPPESRNSKSPGGCIGLGDSDRLAGIPLRPGIVRERNAELAERPHHQPGTVKPTG